MRSPVIRLRGVREHNLKDLDLELPQGQLIVITGVSGAGKSSLVFDTLYAESQRRYVETFSPYVRQFLDRLPRPAVRSIEGLPPGIGIRRYNPMHNTRSTVGTMTEIQDHLRLLYTHLGHAHCPRCGDLITAHDPESASRQLMESPSLRGMRIHISFHVHRPPHFSNDELGALLLKQGYVRTQEVDENTLYVEQDRMILDHRSFERLEDAMRAAFRHGTDVVITDDAGSRIARYSTKYGCARCGTEHPRPQPHLFSFNHPLGACEACSGFGRVSGIDPARVIPDPMKSLRAGAVKPWQTESYQQCQKDLLHAARRRGISIETPWIALDEASRRWVWDGEGEEAWERGGWYGIAGFFRWLESRTYRRHVRILLAQYRAYVPCHACQGMRLRPEALDFRLGDLPLETFVPTPLPRPRHADMPQEVYVRLPGLNIYELTTLPVESLVSFFDRLTIPEVFAQAGGRHLLEAVRERLHYLMDVGLSYLTLDRATRTLSGGELQRINLTTALGTGLSHTLFVLDEPSSGLHPRDIGRLVGVLQRLRDAGNTVVVIDHDPVVLRSADYLVDLGPRGGEQGGRIVFAGRPSQLHEAQESLTADYLLGRLTIGMRRRKPLNDQTRWLRILGVHARNLRGVDISLPLGHLVSISGVSGSGKSTLLRDVLTPALSLTPPEGGIYWKELQGREHVGQVTLVDQSLPARSTRSIPASHVGVWDAIRRLFATLPLAVSRGYTAGHFSFNSPLGACPHCEGSGQETLEMPYMADVVLPCPQCQGSRYRPEILEVRLSSGGSSWSIADILTLTISQARTMFADHPDITSRLASLEDIGLGYLRLGQSFSTLSGGEAQRLKLATYLAPAVHGDHQTGQPPTLFLLDEPTTGLHPADISVLMSLFERLLARSHTIVVVEHNLDVIAASDWVIDLGPEGGERGGRVVASTTPELLIEVEGSQTGQALRTRSYQESRADPSPPPPSPAAIEIKGARVHNLRNLSVQIPHDRLTVLTGLSGSGKSTLAFDVVFSEGQRRFLDTLNAYVRQYIPHRSRAEVDAIEGLSPTVAIEQRTSRGGIKSTVATLTEIHPFLRLLYTHLGKTYCPRCDIPVETRDEDSVVAELHRKLRGESFEILVPIVRARKGHYRTLGAWARRHGYERLCVDGRDVAVGQWVPLSRYHNHTIELVLGPHQLDSVEELKHLIERSLTIGEGRTLALRARGETHTLTFERTCPRCAAQFPDPDPYLFSFSSPLGWCPECEGTGVREHGHGDVREREPCPSCGGGRLRPEALSIRLGGKDIAWLTAQTTRDARAFLAGLRFTEREKRAGEDLRREILNRLDFLIEVGLGYLTLDRAAPTLSGGEAQRLRLASQLGTNLRGVCYVLDEPSIGLHPSDQRKLIGALHRLRDAGNTVLVVEHDEDMMKASDHMIDLGPGAGREGGQVVGEGPWETIVGMDTPTGRALAHHSRTVTKPKRPFDPETDPSLSICGIRCRNLQRVDVTVPLQRLVVVTGVSGSGKSTLVHNVLLPAVNDALSRRKNDRSRSQDVRQVWTTVQGTQLLGRVLEIDQSPIGHNPRSCPATYVGLWDGIRALFAQTVEARALGYGVSRFSFNTKAGACPQCRGQGILHLEMQFLPDVHVPCEACGGRRFAGSVNMVRWQGLSIADVLQLTVSEACALFVNHPRLLRSLKLMQEVGLGYLALGQPSPTLSGGEAQRIKLVSELARSDPRHSPPTLYVLDEPTVGLHQEDVARLLAALDRLVEAGHTVVVIEHNLDVMQAADWIIDLGPGGGPEGGRVVGAGPPQYIRRLDTATGRSLAASMRET